MHIGILADTHDRLDAVQRACSLFKEEDISVLLHAGDFISPFVIPLFKGFELYGTFGNNDGEKRGLLTRFGEIKATVTEYFCAVEIDHVKIAVTHGHISPLFDLLVKSHLYDLVVTAHTHTPALVEGASQVMNPGECCGYVSNRSTVGVFDTEKKKGEIVEL